MKVDIDHERIRRLCNQWAESLDMSIHALKGITNMVTELQSKLRLLPGSLPNPTDPGDPIRRAIEAEAKAGETR